MGKIGATALSRSGPLSEVICTLAALYISSNPLITGPFIEFTFSTFLSSIYSLRGTELDQCLDFTKIRQSFGTPFYLISSATCFVTCAVGIATLFPA